MAKEAPSSPSSSAKDSIDTRHRSSLEIKLREDIRLLELQHREDQVSLRENAEVTQNLSEDLAEVKERAQLAEQEVKKVSIENGHLKRELELAQSQVFSLQPYSRDLTPDTLGRVSA